MLALPTNVLNYFLLRSLMYLDILNINFRYAIMLEFMLQNLYIYYLNTSMHVITTLIAINLLALSLDFSGQWHDLVAYVCLV